MEGERGSRRWSSRGLGKGGEEGRTEGRKEGEKQWIERDEAGEMETGMKHRKKARRGEKQSCWR